MHLSVVLAFLLAPYAFAQNEEDIPKINGSYKAMGELVANLDDTTFQVAFEEHFDVVTGNSAFTIFEMENKISYVENVQLNETIEYLNDKECAVVTKQDWIDTDSPPSLIGYVSTTGNIRFSLRKLFDLDDKYLVERNKSDTIRDIPVQSWVYEIKSKEGDISSTVTVYAYWSAPGWTTPSRHGPVPVGYEITRITRKDKQVNTTTQFVNVFGFIKNIVDQNAFRAREGIYCEGRHHGLRFPDFPGVKSLSLRSEFVLPDFQEVKTMDAYYDVKNGLLRVDLNRLDSTDETTPDKPGRIRTYTSQITSKELNTTFQLKASKKGMQCSVYPLSNYTFDPQEVINPKLDQNLWGIYSILGFNTTTTTTTKFYHIGKSYKRNIPCHIYQGIRTDWPDPSAGIQSLWEWCIAQKMESEDETVSFRDKEIPLVSASVKIINGSYEDFDEDSRMVHHFYDVIGETAANLSLTNFDVSRCFDRNQKYYARFLINKPLTEDNIHIFENATSDVTFLSLWKEAIAKAAKISITSLRLPTIQSFIYQKKLYVAFVLLDLHPDLPPSAAKGQMNLNDTYETLKKAIDNGDLLISYVIKTGGKPEPLAAQGGSLHTAFDHSVTFEQITAPTTTSTQSTTASREPVTLILDTTTQSKATNPDEKTDSTRSSMTSPSVVPTGSSNKPTGSSDKPIEPTGTSEKPTGSTDSTTTGTGSPELGVQFQGHKPGTVAGVSIAMLLIGITIGAGGTFYSYKGLPSFLRVR